MNIYEVDEGFVVDTDSKAEWCLKKIKEEQDEAARMQAMINEQKADLEERERKIRERLDNSTGYFKALLWKYYEGVPHKETKTQSSYQLLHGKLVYKKPVVKIVKPESETELVAYLEQNAPTLVETIKKPAWGDFKKTLAISEDGSVVDTTTGEQLDFIKTEESEAAFDVKID